MKLCKRRQIQIPLDTYLNSTIACTHFHCIITITYHRDGSLLFQFKIFHQRDEENPECVGDPVQRQVTDEAAKDLLLSDVKTVKKHYLR